MRSGGRTDLLQSGRKGPNQLPTSTSAPLFTRPSLEKFEVNNGILGRILKLLKKLEKMLDRPLIEDLGERVRGFPEANSRIPRSRFSFIDIGEGLLRHSEIPVRRDSSNRKFAFRSLWIFFHLRC